MILNDNQIRGYCEDAEAPMIEPFLSHQVRKIYRGPSGIAAISSGLSSYGYDIKLAPDGLERFKSDTEIAFEMYTPDRQVIIDPKSFAADECLIDVQLETDDTGSFYTLPAHSYALGVSVETFDIPDNVLGICYCKSTYARCGLMVNTTPLEPGWRGQLVLELANLTDLPLKVYANEGIAQVVFFTGAVPSVTYADRAGKYQDQRGIVTAKI